MKKGVDMVENGNILSLYTKIICSLLCINKDTRNISLKIKAEEYLNQFLELYKAYRNQQIYVIENSKKIIEFCNECYEDKDIFDFAEDVEYGLRELMEIKNNKGDR